MENYSINKDFLKEEEEPPTPFNINLIKNEELIEKIQKEKDALYLVKEKIKKMNFDQTEISLYKTYDTKFKECAIFPPEEIKIFVSLVNKKVLKLKVNKNATLYELISIMEKKGYELEENQKLNLGCPYEINENKQLTDYGVTDKSILSIIEIFERKVYIQDFNLEIIEYFEDNPILRFSIECNNLDLIYDVKFKISKEHDIPINDQILYFNGQILDNRKTFEFYKISNDDVLIYKNINNFQNECDFMASSYPTDFEIIHKNSESSLSEISELDELCSIILQMDHLSFGISVKNSTKFSELKKICNDNKILEKSNVFFIYNGSLILNETEKSINDLEKEANNLILTIAYTDIGVEGIYFTASLKNIPLKDYNHILYSINDEEVFKKFKKNEEKFKEVMQKYPSYHEMKETDISKYFAITLYTSNLIYSVLNKNFENEYLEEDYVFKIFLKHFYEGIKVCNYFVGTVYRGFRSRVDINAYRDGDIIIWKRISSCTKKMDNAKYFSPKGGTLFEIECFSGKCVETYSFFPNEKEVILMPFSCFKVISCETKDERLYIKLKEIPYPKQEKNLLWVDDNPSNNYDFAKKYGEKYNINCIFTTNTEDAIEIIKNSRWLEKLKESKFIIVSDMHRKENGIERPIAGLEFVREMYNLYQEKFNILIFCGNQKSAIKANDSLSDGCKKICKATSSPFQLESFIESHFDNI